MHIPEACRKETLVFVLKRFPIAAIFAISIASAAFLAGCSLLDASSTSSSGGSGGTTGYTGPLSTGNPGTSGGSYPWKGQHAQVFNMAMNDAPGWRLSSDPNTAYPPSYSGGLNQQQSFLAAAAVDVWGVEEETLVGNNSTAAQMEQLAVQNYTNAATMCSLSALNDPRRKS
jgi:hypothetical protein